LQIIAAGGFAEYLVDKVAPPSVGYDSFEQQLSAALVRLGLVKPGELLHSFEEWHNYEQKGGETYVAAAQVVVEHAGVLIERPFVSKAVINGQETVNRMLKRRAFLRACGILTPELYSVHAACINEQYLPYTIQQHLPQGHADSNVLQDLVHAAAVLDRQGFPTFNYILDMRTDGHRAHYVDFGWDLWDPAENPVSCALAALMAFVKRHLPHLMEEIQRTYALLREAARPFSAGQSASLG